VATLEGGKPRLRHPSHLPHRVDGDDLPPAFDRRAFLKAAVAVGAVAAAGGVTSRTFGGAEAAAARSALDLPTPASALLAPARASTSRDHPLPDLEPRLLPGGHRPRGARRRSTASCCIHGMVDRELELTYEDLLARRLVERRITLTCVSNPVGGEYVGNATWIGIPVGDLSASRVRTRRRGPPTSADDFTAGTRCWSCRRERGTGRDRDERRPRRSSTVPGPMVTPALRLRSATKWLVDPEVTRLRLQGLLDDLGRGEAPIKHLLADRRTAPSPAEGRPQRRRRRRLVQDRGIAKVEVSVDGGDWQEARLAEQDNVNTWRQWVLDWDAGPGNHTLEVRATDATGYTQTAERAPIAPDGSTCWDSVNVTVS
jgi:DMSO/TMAO reductase YedYZ molybdopterin-dependent catalytic subunit